MLLAMPRQSPATPTELLLAWNNGEDKALERLVPLVHDELRRLAHQYMRRERADHTLQATGLVNETYLRLIDIKRIKWQNRAHFFAMSARLMRRILVDMARAHGNQKRGGGARPLSLDDGLAVSDETSPSLIALDDALRALAAIYPRQSEVVELRFFGGLGLRGWAQ